MVRLNKEEKRLVSLYRTGTRHELIETLCDMRGELSAEESALMALTDATLSKLNQMSDAEFESLDIVPDFIKGVFK